MLFVELDKQMLLRAEFGAHGDPKYENEPNGWRVGPDGISAAASSGGLAVAATARRRGGRDMRAMVEQLTQAG